MNTCHWFLLVVSKYLSFLHPLGMIPFDHHVSGCFIRDLVIIPFAGWIVPFVPRQEVTSAELTIDSWVSPSGFLQNPGSPGQMNSGHPWVADSSWWFLWGWTGWTTMRLCFGEILGGWISRQDWEQLLTLIVLCNLKRFQG
jgi:hypothetical protein